MLAHDYPFDTVQMPLNCFDGTYRSFEQHVLPEVQRRGIAGLGMKSLGGDGQPITDSLSTSCFRGRAIRGSEPRALAQTRRVGAAPGDLQDTAQGLGRVGDASTLCDLPLILSVTMAGPLVIPSRAPPAQARLTCTTNAIACATRVASRASRSRCRCRWRQVRWNSRPLHRHHRCRHRRRSR